MNFPSTINIELTNRCNKNCWMCGRRKVEREYPKLADHYNKNISFTLLEKIAKQLPAGIVIQFHSNGEPTLYPLLADALRLFSRQIKCFDTNGKLLLEKFHEVKFLDTMTVSTFENDPEWEEQFYILKKYLEWKGDKRPNVIIRLLGNMEKNRIEKYESLNCLMVKRILHSPMGSFEYKKETVKPETGICLEMLNHPAINVDGDLSICVRFDPNGSGVLGNLNDNTFEELWNSEKRKQWIESHVRGNRKDVPLCSNCEFWGIPRG